jgi:hypothetical protein
MRFLGQGARLMGREADWVGNAQVKDAVKRTISA